jgi:hypothetical protein
MINLLKVPEGSKMLYPKFCDSDLKIVFFFSLIRLSRYVIEFLFRCMIN